MVQLRLALAHAGDEDVGEQRRPDLVLDRHGVAAQPARERAGHEEQRHDDDEDEQEAQRPGDDGGDGLVVLEVSTRHRGGMRLSPTSPSTSSPNSSVAGGLWPGTVNAETEPAPETQAASSSAAAVPPIQPHSTVSPDEPMPAVQPESRFRRRRQVSRRRGPLRRRRAGGGGWRGGAPTGEDGVVATAYRLRAGDTGPVQQSPVTCGSACLTVARMLVDPVFASWVRTGEPHLPGSPDGDDEQERFAAYERVVMRRTNGLLDGRRRPHLPWPRAARHTAVGRQARARARCGPAGHPLRRRDPAAASGTSLREAFDRLVDVVADGEPGLLYIGNAQLPRHVVLVLPGDGDRLLDVYDPGNGRVDHLRRDAVVERRIGLSGWQVPVVRRAADRAPPGPRAGTEPVARGGAGDLGRLTRAPGVRRPARRAQPWGLGFSTGMSSTSLAVHAAPRRSRACR